MVARVALALGLLTSVFAQTTDPCALIANQTYVAPSQALACINVFPFNSTIRDNVLEVVTKTLNFHTSTNYQRQAPAPFTEDVHADVLGELERIRNATYQNDYSFHKDVYNAVGKLRDGHCYYLNMCYDSLYVTYLPFPLVVINEGPNLSEQNVRIAPEAWSVSQVEFAPYIDKWQAKAGFNFSRFDGAKVVSIDGKEPWVAATESGDFVGGWQGKSSRQNGFFASYTRATASWNYRFGDFASRFWPPTKDTVELVVIPFNSTTPETITVPFASRFGSGSTAFTNSSTLWANNCVAVSDTNGVDYNLTNSILSDGSKPIPFKNPLPPRYAEPLPVEQRRQPIAAVIDSTPPSNILLPPALLPPSHIAGNGTSRFYLQGKLGIFALGSFGTAGNYSAWYQNMTDGFALLKQQGATHLLIDVTNNGGGYICYANFLHRFLTGPSNLTEPQAGFDTKFRYNDLTSKVVQSIIKDNGTRLERGYLLYDPVGWRFGNSSDYFPEDYNFMEPPVRLAVNGHLDAFSQKIGQECSPFVVTPPSEPYLPIANIGVINNGRCASSCAILTTTLKEKHGVRVAVLGGKQGQPQQYTGTVGGQSTDFSTLDSEIKSTLLKNDSLAPPDFIVNGYQGFTFRLGFGLLDESHPEEWVDHTADDAFPLTLQTVNNPQAIWKDVAARWWPDL